MAQEFLIRRMDPEGAWFDVKFVDMPTVLRPTTFRSEVIDGHGELRLRMEGVEIEINFEDPGIQVVFYGSIEGSVARQVVEELAQSVVRHTGQSARIIDL